MSSINTNNNNNNNNNSSKLAPIGSKSNPDSSGTATHLSPSGAAVGGSISGGQLTNRSSNDNMNNSNNNQNQNQTKRDDSSNVMSATVNTQQSTSGGAGGEKKSSDNNSSSVQTKEQRRRQKKMKEGGAPRPVANVVIKGVLEKLQIVNHGRIITPVSTAAPTNISMNNNNSNQTNQKLAVAASPFASFQNNVKEEVAGGGVIKTGLGRQSLHQSPPANNPNNSNNNNNTTSSPLARDGNNNNNNNPVAGSDNSPKNLNDDDSGSDNDTGGGVNLSSSRASSIGSASSLAESERERRKNLKSVFDGQWRASHNQGSYQPVTLLGKGSYGQAYLVVYNPSEIEAAEGAAYQAQREQEQEQQQQQRSSGLQKSIITKNESFRTTTKVDGSSIASKGGMLPTNNTNSSNNNTNNQQHTSTEKSNPGGALMDGSFNQQSFNLNDNINNINNTSGMIPIHKTRPSNRAINNNDNLSNSPRAGNNNNNNNNNAISNSTSNMLQASENQSGGLNTNRNSGSNIESNNNQQTNSTGNDKCSDTGSKNGTSGGGGGGNNNNCPSIPAQGHHTMENGLVSFTARPIGGPAGHAGISALACTKPTVTIGSSEYTRESVFVCKVEKDYEAADAEKKQKKAEEKKRLRMERKKLKWKEEHGGVEPTASEIGSCSSSVCSSMASEASSKQPHHQKQYPALQVNNNNNNIDKKKNSSSDDDDEADTRSVHSASSMSSTSSRVADDAGRDRARRMRNEAAVLSNLAHPCVVGFIDSFPRDGNNYLVLEYVDGGDLNKEIARRRASRAGYMTKDSILFIWAQIVLAVEYLHRHNIIHRDIKAANVLLSRKWMIKLSDFGTAEQFDQDVNRGVSNVPMGSPMMMAPELFMGDPQTGVRKVYDEKCDIWSLGVLLWELTFFTYPFDGRDIRELAHHIVHDEPRPVARERTPKELAFLISWMLKKDPSQRPTAKQILRLDFMQKPLLSIIDRYKQAAESKNSTQLDRIWLTVLKEHRESILADTETSQISRAKASRQLRAATTAMMNNNTNNNKSAAVARSVTNDAAVATSKRKSPSNNNNTNNSRSPQQHSPLNAMSRDPSSGMASGNSAMNRQQQRQQQGGAGTVDQSIGSPMYGKKQQSSDAWG